MIDEEMVEKVLKALQGSGTAMPKNWNRRFKHNRDKMKTGDIFELAEVVRNLSLRDHEKGLSTGEKQMFVKAKKILASELMYAKAMDEDEAGVWLDDVLSTVSNGKKKTAKVDRGRERLAPAARRRCPSGPFSPPQVAASGSSADRPKAFAPAQRPAAPRREPRAARGVGLDRLDRRRRSPGLGGAGDPARRGARLREGRRRRSPAARRGPTRCGSAWPRWPTTRP